VPIRQTLERVTHPLPAYELGHDSRVDGRSPWATPRSWAASYPVPSNPASVAKPSARATRLLRTVRRI